MAGVCALYGTDHHETMVFSVGRMIRKAIAPKIGMAMIINAQSAFKFDESFLRFSIKSVDMISTGQAISTNILRACAKK